VVRANALARPQGRKRRAAWFQALAPQTLVAHCAAMSGGWLDDAALGGGELELLDWLDQPPGAVSADEWALDGAACRLPAGDGLAAPAHTPAHWRCLDPSHAPGCAACTPPPREGDEALFQLRGAESDAPTAPSGSARLRAQMLATAEWNNPAARDALAAAEALRGDPIGVAQLLRRKVGRSLLKPHMLCLARAWGYASDLWLRRGDTIRARKRPRAAAAADKESTEHATAVAPSSAVTAVVVPRPLTVVESMSLSPGGQTCVLRQMWRVAADCFLGNACRAECSRTGLAFYNDAIEAEYAIFDAGATRLAGELARLAAAQEAWNAALRRHLEAEKATDEELADGINAAAWAGMPGGRLPLGLLGEVPGCEETPAEVGLRFVLAATRSFEAAWDARRASVRGLLDAAPMPRRLNLDPVDAEIKKLYAHMRRFIAESLLVLHFLAARGSCADYMAAASDAVTEISMLSAEIGANMQDQRRWYSEQCATGKMLPLPARVREHDFERILGTLNARVGAVRVAGPPAEAQQSMLRLCEAA
jgi:hypothetical protein